jgi:hypothetical protein
MTIRSTLIVALALLWAVGARAQVFTPFAAHEGTDLATQAALSYHGETVVFAQAMTLYISDPQIGEVSLDPSNGLSELWAYSYFSETADSLIMVMLMKVEGMGLFPVAIQSQLMDIPPGTNLDSISIKDGWINSPEGVQPMLGSGLSDFLTAHPDAHAQVFVAAAGAWTGLFVSGTDTLMCYTDLYTGQAGGCQNTVLDVLPTPSSPVVGFESPHPNPLSLSRSGLSSVTYRLDRETTLRLAVYDITGRELGTVYEGITSPGTHTLTLPRQLFLHPGLYFVHLVTPGGSAVRKLVVMP